jgi:YVTN family beta-propeller protein
MMSPRGGVAFAALALALGASMGCSGGDEPSSKASESTTGAVTAETAASTATAAATATGAVSSAATVVASVEGGAEMSIPGGWAVAFGFAWLPQGDKGTVARVDPSGDGGTTLVRVGDPSLAIASIDPSAVAVGKDAIWTTSRARNAVVEINPRTRRLKRSIKVGAQAYSIALGGNSLWVTDYEAGTAIHVDVASGRVLGRVRAPGAQGVVAKATDAWIVADESVIRVSGKGTRVVTNIPVGAIPEQAVLGGGAVWVFNKGDETVSQIDVKTNRVVATLPVTVSDPAAVSLAYGAGALWISDASAGTIARVDAAEGREETLQPLGEGVGNAVYADGALWALGPGASDGSEEILRIDISAIGG